MAAGYVFYTAIIPDTNPPQPIVPSLNSNPRCYFGNPRRDVEVMLSPALAMMVKIAFCLFSFNSDYFNLISSRALLFESAPAELLYVTLF